MPEYALQYPVFTFENELLLDAGTVLTPAAVEAMISERKTPFQVSTFLKYLTVKPDLLTLMKQPPYNLIFSDSKQVEGMFNTMEQVLLPVPVLKSLYYFRDFDFYTYRHILIVFALSTLLAEKLITNKREQIQEIIAGPTHDIGKIAVPLDVLEKQTALTRSERSKLEHHVLAGYVLLCYYFQDSNNLAARIARDHHERNDRSGYPGGVCLDDPFLDIVIVSDIYDALIAQRPYRPVSYDNRTAIEEITRMANDGKVNMETVQALVSINRSEKPHYSDCVVSKEERGVPPSENVYGLKNDEDPSG